jgi:hypothetical protein
MHEEAHLLNGILQVGSSQSEVLKGTHYTPVVGGINRREKCTVRGRELGMSVNRSRCRVTLGHACTLLTPKFGKEYDMWVQFEKESVWWKERYFQGFSAEGSAVGYLLQFGKRTVELILRDWTVTWLDRRKRMDG